MGLGSAGRILLCVWWLAGVGCRPGGAHGNVWPPPSCSTHPAEPIGPGAEPPALATTRAWVAAGADGTLVYDADVDGNRVPDFSYAGYDGGGVALPTVAAAPGVAPLAPSGGDDTAAIQAALDAVARRTPDSHGWRGAVVLGAGTFTLAGTLTLAASGVVLRGAGDDASGGTILQATGGARSVIVVGSDARPRPRAHSTVHVTDGYVAVGARVVHVDSTAGLVPGTQVIVARPSSANWICQLGMDDIPPRPDGKPVTQWAPGDGLAFARTVTTVDGDALTLDVPLTNALEGSFAPSTVWAYDFPERIDHVGIEALRGRATFDDADSGYLASLFVSLQAVDDGWVSHVTAEGFGNGAVKIGAHASRVTVADSALVSPIIPATDAEPAGFTIAGQQSLLVRVAVTGENVHAVLTQSQVAGPNAVLDLRVTGTDVDVSAHQRWATGVLFDRIVVADAGGAPSGRIAVQNRGNEGTGQGWAGANSVVWNSRAAVVAVDDPPTAHNWVVGGSAGTRLGTGDFTLVDQMVAPSSLYLGQLRARRGAGALAAIGY